MYSFVLVNSGILIRLGDFSSRLRNNMGRKRLLNIKIGEIIRTRVCKELGEIIKLEFYQNYKTGNFNKIGENH